MVAMNSIQSEEVVRRSLFPHRNHLRPLRNRFYIVERMVNYQVNTGQENFQTTGLPPAAWSS